MKRIYYLFFIPFIFFLVSCSNSVSDNHENGSVEFSINLSSLERSAAREGDRSTAYRVEVSLNGEYSATQTKNITDTTKSVPVSFDDVPKGKMIYAMVKVFKMGNSSLKMYGKSNTIQVVSGPNTLTLQLEYCMDTPVVTYSGSNYFLDNTSVGQIDSYAFDADGYCYYFYNSILRSTNPSLPEINLTEATNDVSAYTNPGILIDLANNDLYYYATNEMTLEMKKFPLLISEGKTDNGVTYSVNFSTPSTFYHSLLSVNNGILYDVGDAYDESGEPCNYLNIVTLQTQGWNANPDKSINLTEELAEKNIVENNGAYIADMIFYEKAVYLILRNFSFEIRTNELSNGAKYYAMSMEPGDNDYQDSYKSRGAVIKYDIASDKIQTLGWTEEPLNFSNQRFYAYAQPVTSANWLTAKNYSQQNFLTIKKSEFSDEIQLPDFYTPSSDSKLYGPDKFVAIKPGQLIVSDDGIKLYSDNYGLKYKNVNRLVNIDLKEFKIDSSSPAKVSFDYDAKFPIFSSYYVNGAYPNSFEFIGWYNAIAEQWEDDIPEISIYLGIPLDE